MLGIMVKSVKKLTSLDAGDHGKVCQKLNSLDAGDHGKVCQKTY